MHLKTSSGKWRPSCLGLNELNMKYFAAPNGSKSHVWPSSRHVCYILRLNCQYCGYNILACVLDDIQQHAKSCSVHHSKLIPIFLVKKVRLVQSFLLHVHCMCSLLRVWVSTYLVSVLVKTYQEANTIESVSIGHRSDTSVLGLCYSGSHRVIFWSSIGKRLVKFHNDCQTLFVSPVTRSFDVFVDLRLIKRLVIWDAIAPIMTSL